MFCKKCKREIEFTFVGKPFNAKGFCVGFNTCKQRRK